MNNFGLQQLPFFGVKVRDDDETKTFEEIVKDYGMQFEEHYVMTSDGYYLKVFHIWHTSKDGPPVFLQHGLFSSADTWILNKEKSVAF